MELLMYQKKPWNRTDKENIPIRLLILLWVISVNSIDGNLQKKNLTTLLGEVKDFVRKARAKSTPGINGISYKLYKRCPISLETPTSCSYLKIHRRGFGISRQNIYIPKEKNSKHLEQF